MTIQLKSKKEQYVLKKLNERLSKMEERVLIRSQSKKSTKRIIIASIWIIFALFLIIEYFNAYNKFIEYHDHFRYAWRYEGYTAFSYGMVIFEYEITEWLFLIAIACTVIAIFLIKCISCNISVLENKIIGTVGLKKEINIPFENIEILCKNRNNGIKIITNKETIKLMLLKNRNEIYDIIRENIGETEEERKLAEIMEKGFRKRCNVCGKIICYTVEDLKKNKELQKQGLLNSMASVAGAFSGHYAASSNSLQTSYDLDSRIIDYTKCPSCGSRDLVDITDEELDQLKKSQQSQIQQIQPSSYADELKKYKDLLDSGVITQEEFDQKKKQLLGL